MSLNTHATSLTFGSVLLTLGVVLIWGFNFIMVKAGLDHMPPLTLCALRFFLCTIPVIFFIPKPNAPWKYVIGYGILTFAIQFSLLFSGMAAGVAPGVTSIIVQLQVFFAIFFAWLLMKQRITASQIVGALVSLTGILVIACYRDRSFTITGLILLLGSALSWGLGNVITVQLRSVNLFSLVVWSSMVAFFPVAFAAYCLEPDFLAIVTHPGQLNSTAILSLGYITYASTYVGYGCWSWLLSKYTMGAIAPFALLIPIITLICSAILFHEPMTLWKITAAVLVISGLGINIFGRRIIRAMSTWVMAIQNSG